MALASCGTVQAPPAPGETRGAVPDLTSAGVMVLPVQSRTGISPEIDAELVFGLRSRGPDVDWAFPDELRRVAAAAPGLQLVVDALPVAIFLQAEVRRVGDPLYGYLRRLGALTDASFALIPVEARQTAARGTGREAAPGEAPERGPGEAVRPATGTGGGAGAGAAGGRAPGADRLAGESHATGDVPVEIRAALLDIRTGQVLWFGVVAGEPGPPGDPRALASAVDDLARRLVPRS